jgi:zinc D-Ala-D-Ala carboxypeptidase
MPWQSIHPLSGTRPHVVGWVLSALIVGAWLSPRPPAGAVTGVVTTVPATSRPAASRAPTATPPSVVPGTARPEPAQTGAVAPSLTDRPVVPPEAIASPRPDLPACRFGDGMANRGTDRDWNLAVVDTDLRLPAGYAPRDLVPVARAGLAGGGSVRRIVLADLRQLAGAARTAGVRLTVRSAYRSETRQKAVFAAWVRASGRAAARRSSARAGHSEHELGTTIDFAAGDVAPWATAFAATRTGRWLATHAPAFGFVMSYPAGASGNTCYDPEPWHFRWVGRANATAVVASGLTLRAWLWRRQQP